jgi:hypothetical protein
MAGRRKTLEGRKFPVQDSCDRAHKNFIYHKMVIGPCPEDDPSDREEKYSFSHLEKTGSGLEEKF